MTNEQLAIRIQTGENIAENMLQLWEQTQAFIQQQARRYQSRAEKEDLEQEGFIGLCQAVDNYDPSQNVQFLTYAAFWIKQAMVRYIQNNCSTIRISTGRRDNIRKFQEVVNTFEKEYGRKPTETEISYFFKADVKTIRKLEEAAQMSQIGSLDCYLTDHSETTVGDTVPDPVNLEGNILDDIQQKQLRKTLWPLVDDLPGDCPQVIQARYCEGLSIEATGAKLGIDPGQARKMERKALNRLRTTGSRKLMPFLDEYISVHAFHGNGVETFNQTWTSSTERIAIDLTNI